jgi:hypothetical protein
MGGLRTYSWGLGGAAMTLLLRVLPLPLIAMPKSLVID